MDPKYITYRESFKFNDDRLVIKYLEEAAIIFTDVFSSDPWNEPWSLHSSYKRLLDISNTLGYIGIGYFNSNNQMIGFIVGNAEQWADSMNFSINEICVLTNVQTNGIGTDF